MSEGYGLSAWSGPGQPAGLGVRAVTAVAAVAPDPARRPLFRPRIRRGCPAMSLEQRGCGIHTTTTRALMVSAGQAVVVVRTTIRRIRPVTPDIGDL
jgi:hypothetical protein